MSSQAYFHTTHIFYIRLDRSHKGLFDPIISGKSAVMMPFARHMIHIVIEALESIRANELSALEDYPTTMIHHLHDLL